MQEETVITFTKQNFVGVSIVGGILGLLMFLTGIQSSGVDLEQLHLSMTMTAMGWLGLAIIAVAVAVIGWCCLAKKGSEE